MSLVGALILLVAAAGQWYVLIMQIAEADGSRLEFLIIQAVVAAVCTVIGVMSLRK